MKRDGGGRGKGRAAREKGSDRVGEKVGWKVRGDSLPLLLEARVLFFLAFSYIYIRIFVYIHSATSLSLSLSRTKTFYQKIQEPLHTYDRRLLRVYKCLSKMCAFSQYQNGGCTFL